MTAPTVFTGIICLSIFLFAGVTSAGSIHPRTKRGASVYPVFPGNQYHNQQNPYSSNDPTSFIHYLGGTGSISNRRSGSEPSTSASSYSSSSAPASNYIPSSAGASSALDSSVLNSYSLSSHGNSGGGSSGSGSSGSGGWSPSSSYGYSGSFYTSDFGHLTPNFANMGTSQTPSYSRPHLPTLSANSLLHSAQTSFTAQNHLYDVLLAAGPAARPYKGCLGCQ